MQQLPNSIMVTTYGNRVSILSSPNSSISLQVDFTPQHRPVVSVFRQPFEDGSQYHAGIIPDTPNHLDGQALLPVEPYQVFGPQEPVPVSSNDPSSSGWYAQLAPVALFDSSTGAVTSMENDLPSSRSRAVDRSNGPDGFAMTSSSQPEMSTPYLEPVATDPVPEDPVVPSIKAPSASLNQKSPQKNRKKPLPTPKDKFLVKLPIRHASRAKLNSGNHRSTKSSDVVHDRPLVVATKKRRGRGRPRRVHLIETPTEDSSQASSLPLPSVEPAIAASVTTIPTDTDLHNDGQLQYHPKRGCWTCKCRRKKCDTTYPICKACVNLGLSCAGYQPEKPLFMTDPRENQRHRTFLAAIVRETKAAKKAATE